MKPESVEKYSEVNLMLRIQAAIPDLSRKLAKIADYTLAEPVTFIRMTSKEICTLLGTSEPTLIRFCQNFGYSGLADFRIDLSLALVAQGSQGLHIEPHASDRRLVNLEAKVEIAKRAASLVRDDRTIILDNGSTVEQMAKFFGDCDPLKIMTSGLVVAQNALESQKHSVMLTGGLIRPGAYSLTGRMTETNIGEMRFDTAYLGADSIDPEAGLSTFLEDEAHQTRAMVKSSRRVVVLADESKFNKPSLHWICDLERVDILVTNVAPDSSILNPIRAHGVQVISTKESII